MAGFVSRIGHTITGPHEFERDCKLLDMVHSARPFEAVTPGVLPALNPDGYPSGDFRIRFMVEHPQTSNGDYILMFKGGPEVVLRFPASPISQAAPFDPGDGRRAVKLTIKAVSPGQTAQVTVDFHNPLGNVSDLHFLREGASLAQAEEFVFSNLFVNGLDACGCGPLRMLSWGDINGCKAKEFDGPTGLCQPSELFWNSGARKDKRGAPYLKFLQLCKQLHRPPWINAPHLMSIDGHYKMARAAKEACPTGWVFLEPSNELWNTASSFPQGQYFISQAQSMIAGGDTRFSKTNKVQAGFELATLWAHDVTGIWKEVFGNEAYRLVPTMGFCAANPAYLQWAGVFAKKYLGGLNTFLRMACITGYFGPPATFWAQTLDNTPENIEAALVLYRADSGAWQTSPKRKQFLDDCATEQVIPGVYEGTASTGEKKGNKEIKLALAKHPEMQPLTRANLTSFFKAADALPPIPGPNPVFMNFLFANKYDDEQTYGATDDVHDLTQPKIAAIIDLATTVPLNDPDPTAGLQLENAQLKGTIAGLRQTLKDSDLKMIELARQLTNAAQAGTEKSARIVSEQARVAALRKGVTESIARLQIAQTDADNVIQ